MEQTYRVVRVTLCMGLAAALAGGLAGGVSAERLPMRVLTTADGLPGDQIACVHGDA